MPEPLTTPVRPPTPEGIDARATGVSAARSATMAQRAWAGTPLRRRVELLRQFRGLLAEHAARLARASAQARQRPPAEALTAEVIPLADACRFLERCAGRILAPRALGRRGRPLWLNGVRSEIRHEPRGVVLIIAPSNYPLFIPGVQVLQALVAGNAVLLKPGAGGTSAAHALADLLHHAGFDHHLIHVLPESPEAARGAYEGGVAKVFLTGSAPSGAAVLGELAPRLVPATMELSGCDAVFIRADADLDLAVRCLCFGLRLNHGATCIAPRRIFVHRSVATELEGRLATALRGPTETAPPLKLKPELHRVLADALAEGAHLLSGQLRVNGDCVPPLVVAGASTSMRLLHEDVFAPVMSLVTVDDDHEAVEMARHCPYALGATIFSRDEFLARELAERVNAGVVIINDVIVPSADPRVPFGGRQRSGFGVTRGAEGLLEMTIPKVVAVRRSRFLPHLDAPNGDNDVLFQNYLLAAHGSGLAVRWRAAKALARLGLNRWRAARSRPPQPPPPAAGPSDSTATAIKTHPKTL
jgi:acyl-CoA reductase-like NAD-dependent aldehyde dehydrogenase